MRFRQIDLKGEITTTSSIEFLYAEMSAASTGPLAIIHYSDDGNEQEYGLRFDLDKRVFIDHFDDPEKEKTLTSSAHTIGSTIFTKLAKNRD